MMSKQDYELVALAFKARLDKFSHNTLSEGAALFMVEAFADVAAQQNPRFNRSMFYAACGITAAEVFQQIEGRMKLINLEVG